MDPRPAVRRAALLAAAGALLAACTRSTTPTSASTVAAESAPAGATMTDTTDERADAMPLEPTARLRAWLEHAADRTPPPRLRLPVVITLDPHGLAIARAEIGLGGAPDAIPLHLDDTALGIALIDRVRSHCPRQDSCVLWLEGRIGHVVGPSPGVANGLDVLPFAISSVGPPVHAAPEAPLVVRIISRSPD